MPIHVFKNGPVSGNNNPPDSLQVVSSWEPYAYIYRKNNDTRASLQTDINGCSGAIIAFSDNSTYDSSIISSLVGTKIVILPPNSSLDGTLVVPTIANDLETYVNSLNSSLTDVEIFSQYVFRFLDSYPDLDIDGVIKAVQDQTAAGLTLALFQNPLPPVLTQPATPVTGSITYPLFASSSGNRADFNLKFLSQSSTELTINSSEAEDFATIKGTTLSANFNNTFKNGITPASGVFFNSVTVLDADTGNTPPLQKTLNFKAMFVESLTPSINAGFTSVYPGITGKQLTAKVKLEGLSLPLDINNAALKSHIGTTTPLFTWSTTGTLLSVTPEGVLSVPENSLLAVGPFTQSVSFSGLNIVTLDYLENGTSVPIDSTTVGISGYLLGTDYRLHSTNPVVSIARLEGSRIPEGTPIPVSFKVKRDIGAFLNASRFQDAIVTMNFKYGDFKLEAPLQFKVSPGIKWYPLTTLGINMGGPVSSLTGVSQTLTQVESTLNQVKSLIEQVRTFVPLLGLFNFNNLPNALSILAGPFVDTLISILNTGLYVAYLNPADAAVAKDLLSQAVYQTKQMRLEQMGKDLSIAATTVESLRNFVGTLSANNITRAYIDIPVTTVRPQFTAEDRDEWIKLMKGGIFIGKGEPPEYYKEASPKSDEVKKLLTLLDKLGIKLYSPEAGRTAHVPPSYTTTTYTANSLNHRLAIAYLLISDQSEIILSSLYYFANEDSLKREPQDSVARYNQTLYSQLKIIIG